MRQYLDCVLTEEGVLVCKQKLTKKPYPMMQMINEVKLKTYFFLSDL